VLNARKAVRFRKTDQMGILLRDMLKAYYAERGVPVGRRELRRMKSRLFVAMNEGARRIAVKTVVRR
jgi:hypothetical protein